LTQFRATSKIGFIKGNTPIDAPHAITVIMAEAADKKDELIITFMDTSKAFDVVDNISMLNCLYR